MQKSNKFDYLIQQAIIKGKNESITEKCIYETVLTHDQISGNYEWLHPYYGKVLWIDFEEPIDSGHWRTYDRYWWARHAALVSHDPKDLVEEHVKFYVDPTTKIINLKFWFETIAGEVYSMAPTTHFYELERDYFDRWGLCQDANSRKYPQHRDESGGPNYLYDKESKIKKRNMI